VKVYQARHQQYVPVLKSTCSIKEYKKGEPSFWIKKQSVSSLFIISLGCCQITDPIFSRFNSRKKKSKKLITFYKDNCLIIFRVSYFRFSLLFIQDAFFSLSPSSFNLLTQALPMNRQKWAKSNQKSFFVGTFEMKYHSLWFCFNVKAKATVSIKVYNSLTTWLEVFTWSVAIALKNKCRRLVYSGNYFLKKKKKHETLVCCPLPFTFQSLFKLSSLCIT